MGIDPITGEFYIGYREANTKPSHIDLFEYKTSSEVVKLKFDRMNWIIVAEFESGNYAWDFEQLSIYENWNNPLLLNEHCRYGSKARFKSGTPSEETLVKLRKPKKNTENMKKAALLREEKKRINGYRVANEVRERISKNNGRGMKNKSHSEIAKNKMRGTREPYGPLNYKRKSSPRGPYGPRKKK